jgi:hypothetical protein
MRNNSDKNGILGIFEIMPGGPCRSNNAGNAKTKVIMKYSYTPIINIMRFTNICKRKNDNERKLIFDADKMRYYHYIAAMWAGITRNLFVGSGLSQGHPSREQSVKCVPESILYLVYRGMFVTCKGGPYNDDNRRNGAALVCRFVVVVGASFA